MSSAVRLVAATNMAMVLLVGCAPTEPTVTDASPTVTVTSARKKVTFYVAEMSDRLKLL